MPPKKPSLDKFIKTCSPLHSIPALEKKMRQRVRDVMDEILRFETRATPAATMSAFLQNNDDALGIMLALTNLSQEKFLRILTAERFASGDFKPEWGATVVKQKIKTDNDFAEKIANLFLQGKNNALLKDQLADFYLAQLSLPENWEDDLLEETRLSNFVRKKLSGEYADQKGKHIEELIGKVLKKTKIPFVKGQVEILGGKEADIAMPSTESPFLLAMSSYMETTSSSQTTRANEQRGMFLKIQDHNQRHPKKPDIIFVNVVDGGGWLARRSDLAKLHSSCHYCLNLSTLPQLADIAKHYVK